MNDSPTTDAASCCGPPGAGPERQRRPDSTPAEPRPQPSPFDEPWIDGARDTPVGPVPRVATTLTRADRVGSWKARWGIGRMRYRVHPGLYAAGRPTPQSPVLVTANYKMSFDRLRTELTGRDAWIMVLDTGGINVWCAAGKGTFGTDEIVRRAEAVRLNEVVTQRRLVLPQLGAPGVCAHEVLRRSRFRVVYGPVRAEDLPAFLEAGYRATPQMRRVRFPLRDRVALLPIELVQGAKTVLLIAVGLLLLAGLGPGIYSFERVASVGLPSAAVFLGAFVGAVVLTPALLPWLPGRAFSAKGAWVGLAYALLLGAYAWTRPGTLVSPLSAAAWLLMIVALASFVGMNFTGVSTYTSLSGVRREMRLAVPLQMACAVIGAGLWLAGRFV